MRPKHCKEFLDTLKATAGLQDIPVIILSTSSDSVTAHKLKAEGASGFPTNPTVSKNFRIFCALI